MSISRPSIFDISLIVDIICEYLTLSDIENCLHVNKHWYSLFLPNTWRTVYLKCPKRQENPDNKPYNLKKEEQDVLRLHHHKILHLAADHVSPETFKDIARSCKKLKSLIVRDSYVTWDIRQKTNNSNVTSSSAPTPPCDSLFSIAIDALAMNSGLQSLELHVANDDDERLRNSLISTLAAHKSISKLKWNFSTCRIFDGFEVKVAEIMSFIDHLPESIVELELACISETYWETCGCCGPPEHIITDYSRYEIDYIPEPIYDPIKIFNLKTLRIVVDDNHLPLDNSVIIPLLKHSPYLEELSLPGWNRNSIESLINVLKRSCPRLRNLDICRSGASDVNISHLIRGLDDHRLESLTFSFNDGGLGNINMALARSMLCSTLTHLKLQNLKKNMEAKDLIQLLDYLVSLKSLTLNSYHEYCSNYHAGIPLEALVTSLENNPLHYINNLEFLEISLFDDVWKEWDNNDQKHRLISLLVRLHQELRRLPSLKNLKLDWGENCFGMSTSEAVSYAQTLNLSEEQAMTAEDFMWIRNTFWLTSHEVAEPDTLGQGVRSRMKTPRMNAKLQADESCFEVEYMAYKSRNRHHSRSGKKRSEFKRPFNK